MNGSSNSPYLGSDTSPSDIGPTRSHYHLSRQELIKGLANRFVFSQVYIWLYLSMAIISLTTVVLSVVSDCPTLPFYILDIIVNMTMVIEVSIRFLAFGKQFWKSPFNWLDLVISTFCIFTLLIIFLLPSSSCSKSARSEERFDTILLLGRNLVQFARLALMLRRSGKSVFGRIQPIDLEDVQGLMRGEEGAWVLDLDLEDEERGLEERRADGGDRLAKQARAQRSGQGRLGGGNWSRGPDDAANTRSFVGDSDDDFDTR